MIFSDLKRPLEAVPPRINYKIVYVQELKRYLVVPRECFIKEQCEQFSQHFNQDKKTIIQGYYGEEPKNKNNDEILGDDIRARHALALEVMNLDIFCDDLDSAMRNMKNGHLCVAGGDFIERGLIIRTRDILHVLGAISYIIDLKKQKITLHALAVSDDHRNQGIGSALMHTALLIGRMYGFQNAYVQSTKQALGLYIRNGFVLNDRKYKESVGYINDTKEILKFDDLPQLVLKNEFPESIVKCNNEMLKISPGFDYEKFSEIHHLQKAWEPFNALLLSDTQETPGCHSKALARISEKIAIPDDLFNQLDSKIKEDSAKHRPVAQEKHPKMKKCG